MGSRRSSRSRSRGGGSSPDARGRELNREGEVVEPPTDLGDDTVRLHLPAQHEELERFCLGEGQDGKLALPGEAQALATRAQQLQVRTSLEQLGELGHSRDKVLQIVQNEQHPPLANMTCQLVLRTQRLGNGLHHQRLVLQRRQAHPEHARGVVAHDFAGRFDCQPCLARPARPGQRHKARA